MQTVWSTANKKTDGEHYLSTLWRWAYFATRRIVNCWSWITEMTSSKSIHWELKWLWIVKKLQANLARYEISFRVVSDSSPQFRSTITGVSLEDAALYFYFILVSNHQNSISILREPKRECIRIPRGRCPSLRCHLFDEQRSAIQETKWRIRALYHVIRKFDKLLRTNTASTNTKAIESQPFVPGLRPRSDAVDMRFW